MTWPRPIDGAPNPLTLEGLRQRLGGCPDCGARLSLRLAPARVASRKRRHHRDAEIGALRSRPLVIECTARCGALFDITRDGRIAPSAQKRPTRPEDSRVFLAAFESSGHGAELSLELADELNTWQGAGIDYAMAIEELRSHFDARRAP